MVYHIFEFMYIQCNIKISGKGIAIYIQDKRYANKEAGERVVHGTLNLSLDDERRLEDFQGLFCTQLPVMY